MLFTDGGLPFQSSELHTFLRHWKVEHVTSSAFYPQGNGRAELAVKSAKRILRENTAIDGSLNSEEACRALLQYRNTPLLHLGLSPAQLLFHRSLRDGLPVNLISLRPSKLWIEAARKREEAFVQRNRDMLDRYNRSARALPLIPVGTNVLVQDHNDKRWRKMGIVVEVENRKYFIRMHGSGRVITRNRRFLRPIQGDRDCDMDPLVLSPPPPTSPNEGVVSNARDDQITRTTSPAFQAPHESSPASQAPHESSLATPEPHESSPATQETQDSSRVTHAPVHHMPQMLKRLQPFNQPGLKE